MLLLLVTVAATQGTRLFTRPPLPPENMLERLDLTLAWHTRVTMEGPRDGIRSLQLAPGKKGLQFIVQTRRGSVAALDAETGDLLWQTEVGVPYWVGQPVAFNSHAIFVTRREYLYGLDRTTGQHLINTIDLRTKQPKPGMLLTSVPSGAPVADEHMLYIPFSSRIYAFMLPFERKKSEQVGLEEFARGAGDNELYVKWVNNLLGLRTEQPLLLGGPALGAVSPNGTFISMGSTVLTDPIFFKTGEPVATAPGQYENFAYVGTDPGNVYAINMATCDQAWRFGVEAPLFRGPQVTARDVYVSPDRLGLYRLDRLTGLARWLNRDAARFLATNGQFVYAGDTVGRLLVLDYFRGTTLAAYDALRDYPVVYQNELTDRVYLGSNDGLIICLHHRGQRTPLLNKLPPPPPPAPKKGKELKPEVPKDNGEKVEPGAKAEPGAMLQSFTVSRPEPLDRRASEGSPWLERRPDRLAEITYWDDFRRSTLR
jgi:outer membrane protein assembly factor BamB